jgi:raffinose/stachyose/melibiose transport system substrate-binding protein
MNSKRIFVLVSLLALVSMVAAQCGALTPTAEPAVETEAAEKVVETAAVETVEVEKEAVATAAPEEVKLTVWWWGEQEAPGLEQWMDETVQMYMKEHPGVQIETVLQATEALYPAFRSAAEAGEGPDIEYLWSGIWTMEDVWAGNVAPISDYISEAEMSHIFPAIRAETTWNDKTWGLGWYYIGVAMAYNKQLFAEAGLDPDNPPETWDELMQACDALNAAGITPWGYGAKGEIGTTNLIDAFLPQGLDQSYEMLEAAVGDASYAEERFTGWIAKLDEAIERGCFNEDVPSLEFYQGADLFASGQAAMTYGATTMISGWEKELGSDVVGIMLSPVFGEGESAGKLGITGQVLVIPSFADNPEAAADLLAYFHTPERLAAMYEMSGALPPDDQFDTSIVTSEVDKQILEWARTKGIVPFYDFLPTKIDREAFGVVVDMMFAHEKTPEEAAQFIEDYAVKWRAENPDTVEQLRNWLKGVAPAGVAEAEATPAGGPQPPEGDVKLTVWWWGEQEAPGLEQWMDETVQMYMAEYPNVQVETVLQATEALYPAFRSAAEAGEGPDIEYLWSGIWTMEDVWAGNVAPASDYMGEAEMSHIFPAIRAETTWNDKTWGLGWYYIGVAMAYNKQLFAEAGLDPDNPPETWDELMQACDALNAAGITPWGYGAKGEIGTGNFIAAYLPQGLDNTAELLDAAIGDASFAEERFTGWTAKLEEAIERGCFNEDVPSLEFYQGADLFPAGQAAMTFVPTSMISTWEKELGSDVVGMTLAPIFGEGMSAGTLGITGQVLVIPTFADNPETAAHLLAYFHTPERLKAMYEMSGALPPDDRFDTGALTSEVDKKIVELALTKGSVHYQDYLPTKIDREAFGVVIDEMFAHAMTPEEAAQFIEDYAVKWRADNPDVVDQLRSWKEGLK